MNSKLKNIILAPMNFFYKVNPKAEIKLMFHLKEGYKLNLKNPKTYNEKLNWIKLYYKNELMPMCADKYTVRKYVKDCGYGEFLNELLWHGFDARDIPFDDLPKQFVMKVTHGSGNNIICKDRSKLNKEKAIKQLNKWLKEKYLPCYGEWFYGVIKPRIIVEEFLSNDGISSAEDYKMYYFNNIQNRGKGVGFTALDIDRFINHKKTFYDHDWNILTDVTCEIPNDINNLCSKPKIYEEMVKCVNKLAEPFPHVRVDLYIVQDKLYFGEMTFTDGAGFDEFKPRYFSEKMGDWIKLPSDRGGSIGKPNI